MKCKCGTYNDKNAYFCENCGHKLKTKFNWLAIFFAMLFVIATGFAIVFYNSNNKSLSQSLIAEQVKQELEKANVVFQKELDEKQSEIDKLKKMVQDNLKPVARIKELENEIARLKKQPQKTVTIEKEIVKEDPKQTRKIEEQAKRIKELEKELVTLKNKYL
jgi:peptidoglycan hydrolase CwlO-like protein